MEAVSFLHRVIGILTLDTRVDHMVLAQRHLSHGQVSLETLHISSLMAYGRWRNLMSLYSLIYYRQRG